MYTKRIFKNIKIKISKVKLCHIDVNTYEDTKIVFIQLIKND